MSASILKSDTNLGNLFSNVASGEPLAKAEISLSMGSIIGIGIALVGAGLIIKKA